MYGLTNCTINNRVCTKFSQASYYFFLSVNCSCSRAYRLCILMEALVLLEDLADENIRRTRFIF